MADAPFSGITSRVYSASTDALPHHHIAEPTKADMESMYAALDAVDPRPSREEEDARELADLERSRRFAQWVAFGHLEEAA